MYSTFMLHDDDRGPEPEITDKRPAPRWCLVVMPQTSLPIGPVRILALTEDCIEAATGRGWVVIARDSDLLP